MSTGLELLPGTPPQRCLARVLLSFRMLKEELGKPPGTQLAVSRQQLQTASNTARHTLLKFAVFATQSPLLEDSAPLFRDVHGAVYAVICALRACAGAGGSSLARLSASRATGILDVVVRMLGIVQARFDQALAAKSPSKRTKMKKKTADVSSGVGAESATKNEPPTSKPQSLASLIRQKLSASDSKTAASPDGGINALVGAAVEKLRALDTLPLSELSAAASELEFYASLVRDARDEMAGVKSGPTRADGEEPGEYDERLTASEQGVAKQVCRLVQTAYSLSRRLATFVARWAQRQANPAAPTDAKDPAKARESQTTTSKSTASNNECLNQQVSNSSSISEHVDELGAATYAPQDTSVLRKEARLLAGVLKSVITALDTKAEFLQVMETGKGGRQGVIDWIKKAKKAVPLFLSTLEKELGSARPTAKTDTAGDNAGRSAVNGDGKTSQ